MKENLMSSKKRNRLLLFFWISFLIHAIFLIIVMFNAFKKQPTFIIIPLQKHDLKTLQKLAQQKKKNDLKKGITKKEDLMKNELPASLKPRKSEFGSTVFFDNKPQFTPPQAKIIGPQDQQGLDLEKPLLQQQKAKSQLQVQNDIKKEIKEKSKPEIKKITEKPKAQELKTLKKDMLKTSLIQEKKEAEEIKKRIKDIEAKQEILANAHNLPPVQIPKMQKLKTFGQDNGDKSPIVGTTKKSIISMTRGYIENLKGDGNDWLERKGDDNKRPSFEELKYISYEEKVAWLLQSSWKQNFASNPTLKIPEGQAVVEFQIKKDGTVHDITLLQSSGNQPLDQVILKSIEFASPFPPLPKHFNTDNYKTGRIIHVTHQLLKF